MRGARVVARGGRRWLEREMEPLLVLFAVYVLLVIVVLNKPCLGSLRYFEMERQHAMLEAVDAEVLRRREEAESYCNGVVRTVQAETTERSVTARLVETSKTGLPVCRQGVPGRSRCGIGRWCASGG